MTTTAEPTTVSTPQEAADAIPVLRGQIDSSARIIWVFEKFGWVRDVRWPSRERVQMKLEATP